MILDMKGENMNIITDECIVCASFKECGTDIMKGSVMCGVLRAKNKQTKADMFSKLAEVAKVAGEMAKK